jgi:uncharacterized protein involved in exopolysaccharide biosynthesis
MEEEKKGNEHIELRLIDLWHFFRKYAPSTFLVGLLFSIIGYAFSFTFTKYYSARIVVLPESESGKMNSGMRSLVSSALGFGNLNSTEAFRPDLYPEVLSTVRFAQKVLATPVVDKEGTKYPSYEAYLEAQNKEKPKSFLSFFSGDRDRKTEEVKLPKLEGTNVMTLSKKELRKINAVLGSVSAEFNHRTSAIEISSVGKDPVIAAIIADLGGSFLVEYIQEYRTGKNKDHMEFLEKNVAEAKSRLQRAQLVYQQFRDMNRNPFLNVAKVEETRLYSEVETAQILFSNLVQEYEKARLQVYETKPVLTILHPTQVPTKTSSPRRVYIAFYTAVLAALLFLFYVVFFKEKLHRKLS